VILKCSQPLTKFCSIVGIAFFPTYSVKLCTFFFCQTISVHSNFLFINVGATNWFDCECRVAELHRSCKLQGFIENGYVLYCFLCFVLKDFNPYISQEIAVGPSFWMSYMKWKVSAICLSLVSQMWSGLCLLGLVVMHLLSNLLLLGGVLHNIAQG
jgi:hypothetical protein